MKRVLYPLTAVLAVALFVLLTPTASSAEPPTPQPDPTLLGSADADGYRIHRDGKRVADVSTTTWSPVSTGAGRYRVSAIRNSPATETAKSNTIVYSQSGSGGSGVELISDRDPAAIQATDSQPATDNATAAKLEWTRFASIPGLIQGDVAESFHPNALGQQALGKCLELSWNRTNANVHTCTRGGSAPKRMVVG